MIIPRCLLFIFISFSLGRGESEVLLSVETLGEILLVQKILKSWDVTRSRRNLYRRLRVWVRDHL